MKCAESVHFAVDRLKLSVETVRSGKDEGLVAGHCEDNSLREENPYGPLN